MSAQASQSLSKVGIGASEVAAALGKNPWKSRYGLWLEKTGRAEPFTGNARTALGLLVEPFARQRYSNETRYELAIPEESMFHPTIPWMRATPDALVPGSHVVQLKSSGYWASKQWFWGPPEHVKLQVTWEMGVAQVPRADIGVLIGAEDLEWEKLALGLVESPDAFFASAAFNVYTEYLDEQLLAECIAGARDFLDLVESDTPPPNDESEPCQRWHEKRASSSPPGIVIPWSEEIQPLILEFYEASRLAKDTDRRLAVVKNELRDLMASAGADAIETGDGPITWQRRGDGRAIVSPRAWSNKEVG